MMARLERVVGISSKVYLGLQTTYNLQASNMVVQLKWKTLTCTLFYKFEPTIL